MNKIKKPIIALLLFAFLNMAFVHRANAIWDSPMMAEIWKQTTEEMVKSIYDTTLANLKIAALRILSARLMSLLGSNNSTTAGVTGYIISDWKMFIYSSADKYSNQITSDFFQGLSSGAAPGMQQRVIGPAMLAVNTDYWSMRPNLQTYVANGDASKIFQAGQAINPWAAWQAAAQPQNDLAFTYLRAESYKQAAYNQEVAARQAEGVAGQGNASKEIGKTPVREATTSSGARVSVPAGSSYQGQNITTPGSMIGNLTNEINMMPIKMLTMAQTIPQVVTNMANQMISQVIQQGVTKMTTPGGSGGGFDSAGMSQQMNMQAQMLIQNGVRQAASPNMFFGR